MTSQLIGLDLSNQPFYSVRAKVKCCKSFDHFSCWGIGCFTRTPSLHPTSTVVQLMYSTAACPVSWGCRIHQLLLCRGVRLPTLNKYPGVEVQIMLQSTPLLLSFPGPLRPRAVAPDRVLPVGQIILNCVLMLN